MATKIQEPKKETGTRTPVYGEQHPSVLEEMIRYYEKKLGIPRKKKYRQKPYSTGKTNMAKAPREALESEEKSIA
jgi:hypothetical protein